MCIFYIWKICAFVASLLENDILTICSEQKAAAAAAATRKQQIKRIHFHRVSLLLFQSEYFLVVVAAIHACKHIVIHSNECNTQIHNKMQTTRICIAHEMALPFDIHDSISHIEICERTTRICIYTRCRLFDWKMWKCTIQHQTINALHLSVYAVSENAYHICILRTEIEMTDHFGWKYICIWNMLMETYFKCMSSEIGYDTDMDESTLSPTIREIKNILNLKHLLA